MRPEPGEKPLKSRLIPVRSQVIRFVTVGAVNAVFSYSVYAILLLVGFNYALANLGAMLLGILFSFHTQGKFVFENTDIRRIGRFVFVWTLIYIMTITIIGFLIAYSIDPYTAGAIALPASVLASFFAQKYFVFRKNSRGEYEFQQKPLE